MIGQLSAGEGKWISATFLSPLVIPKKIRVTQAA